MGSWQLPKYWVLFFRALPLGLLCVLILLTPSKSFASIADLDQALTLTQVQQDGELQTILVISEKEAFIKGYNLSQAFGLVPKDSLDLLRIVGEEQIRSTVAKIEPRSFLKKDIVISPALQSEHVAAGANYVAHGKEAGIDTVFLFPKFAEATGISTQVSASQGSLLDYEIELCARFDRTIASIEQFRQSVKGFFLCGDFTDRAVLIRSIDVMAVESGLGFTDAKSGPGRFPVGPYTVVPRNWSAFLESIEMTLTVNEEVRQHASGSGMIMKLDHIVEAILLESVAENEQKNKHSNSHYNWQYKGNPITLVSNGVIRKGTAILTGTPEGVVFKPPSAIFVMKHIAKWLFTLRFRDESLKDYVINSYVEENNVAKNHLQPGDSVMLTATSLGKVNLTITE